MPESGCLQYQPYSRGSGNQGKSHTGSEASILRLLCLARRVIVASDRRILGRVPFRLLSRTRNAKILAKTFIEILQRLSSYHFTGSQELEFVRILQHTKEVFQFDFGLDEKLVSVIYWNVSPPIPAVLFANGCQS